MCCFGRGRLTECRALAAGILVEDLEGLTVPLLFCAAGTAPRIYLPAGWTGLIREAAICLMTDRFASRCRSEAVRRATWAGFVAEATGLTRAGETVAAD